LIIWSELTTREVERLDRALPVILPCGLVEAHGSHLSLGFDTYAAEYVARRLCEATGAILCPTLPYGFADTNREYPGTLGVRAETLAAIVADLCAMFCFHGFLKVIILSGHGGNDPAVRMGFEKAWERYPALKPAHWTYFTAAGVALSHADAGETSLALAMGATAHPDRAEDFQLRKPWHEVRSRRALAPDSGGVNGKPSEATAARGEELIARIMPILIDKVNAAIADE